MEGGLDQSGSWAARETIQPSIPGKILDSGRGHSRNLTERRNRMPHYIALVSFTDQGIRDVKNSIKRADRVRKLAAKHKVKIRDIHWTMGKYDIIVTFDAASDAALSAFTLENASLGNVRTETFRAYTRDEFADILKAI
jgi:uncharacterized protein with GYD domain